MGIKIVGAEFNAFYQDPSVWGQPDDRDTPWHEEVTLTINGKEVDSTEVDLTTIADTDQLHITGGVVFFAAGSSKDFLSVLRKWRKAQASRVAVIEFDASIEAAVLKALAELGVKVR